MRMKLTGLICLMAALTATAASGKPAETAADGGKVWISTSFHEPATEGLRFIYSRDGVKWDSIAGVFLRPEVGQQKVMRDPSIACGPDGTFHLVWTSSWRGDQGFGYSSSKDLIHWTPQRFIATGMDTATVNTWAPELFYDDTKRQFLVVWASCVPGRFPDGQEEHRNNHRLYYMTTRDFKTFSKTQLFYEPGFSAIDATLVKRGKGDYVMVVKDNTRPMRNIKVAFAQSPYGPWSQASEPFTEQFTEGPSTAKVGDWWYIYYDSYRNKIYGAHRTKDFKTFEDQTSEVSFPVGHKHGTVFRADEKLVEGLVKYNRDVVHYTGKTIARPERHDGGLKPVVGVHSIQTMRGEKPWTYNHQPMITYWNGRFYMHYLTDPRHEHEAPGKTMLQTSDDGYTWTRPVELFPEYPVPEGWTKPGTDLPAAHNLKAVMHQRVGWYVAPNGRLIATGNYGICLTMKDDPNDGNGIGRVVREVKQDGSFGPIYFVYYNHDFSEKNTEYPYYKKCKDKAFVRAVDAMLADPMQRMQWVEEADRGDKLLPLDKPYKAFCGYTLPDGRKVALWKHAVTSLSADGGNTWRLVSLGDENKLGCDRAPGFVNSNAKIWGQRLTDGTYATVYNPAEYRWPLAISLSQDGLEYTTLSLVNGEVTPLRHGGQYKSYGPQYTRGIQERPQVGTTAGMDNGVPKDSDLWVTYSNNKEDMWVSRIPVPVALNATTHTRSFAKGARLADLTDWNLYMPLLCPITLGDHGLTLADSDPYDYAKAERIIPNTKELEVEFDLMPSQTDHGELDIEFLDDGGTVCSRIVVDSTGAMRVKGGARYGTLLKQYEAGKVYHVKAVLSTSLHRAVYYVNGRKACTRQFDTPVESISRIVFRTGPLFDKPDINTPADQDFDMPRADETEAEAAWTIANVTSRSQDADGHAAMLRADDYQHYVDNFNQMEDENIVHAIPNAQAWEWMTRNVPLFDCPQKQFEEMWYYRWWTLRKHIELTPVGYAMTEFLVNRNYADKWKLISSAVGHHIHESRWLRDTTYLDQIVTTWYRGNGGKPMEKLLKYSSWIAHSLWERYKVDGRKDWITAMLPSLEWEYNQWETTHTRNNCYWQEDVRDAMEETISGGRKKKYLRPSINAYMYGNACAIGNIATLAGDEAKAKTYFDKAADLRERVHEKLWNEQHQFFETHRVDSSSNVREAIGFMPWYTRMAKDEPKYGVAWLQAADPQGFSAPYGLTTAERRHPQFRTHGVGQCEWDGAVWPFATSQTLTAMANYLNDYSNPVITDSLYFAEMEKYVQSQHKRGKPYIGEYLDETTGYWLKGDQERSRYYNHSTFCDLVITGICGLRPRADQTLEVRPLLPAGKWDYFCLDNVAYHGHNVTIVYDRYGTHYHAGKGLSVYVDGQLVGQRAELGKLTIDNALQ